MTVERRVKGFIPTLDRKQITEVFVANGANFLVDAEGPYAAFGSEIPTKEQISNPGLANTFRVGNQIFLLTSSGVLAFDTVSQLYYPTFIFSSPLNEIFPWSRAIVGGLHYFAKKGSLLIEYDPFTNTWTEYSNVVTADTLHAVMESGGRLVTLSQNFVAWSAIDDGPNLDVSKIDEGVGAQLLSKVGNGQPIGIFRTFDGFITYTKSGLMKSQLIDNPLVFRHDRLTGDDDDSEFIPISPYCVIQYGRNTHLILSKAGFYLTNGNVPEQYQPLLSEFFRRRLFPIFDLSIDGTLKLTYNSDRQWLFVSISDLQRQFEYNRAYVIYKPTDELGLFNRNHTNFGEINFISGPFKGFNFGYFCNTGCMHRFTDFPRVENHPDNGSGAELPLHVYFHHEVLDVASRIENNITIMSTALHLTTLDPGLFTLGSGLYEYKTIDEFLSPQTVSAIVEPIPAGNPVVYTTTLEFQTGYVIPGWGTFMTTYSSVNSFIDIGLFQPTAEIAIYPDTATLVTDVVIGALDQPASVTIDDWAQPVDMELVEDWLNQSLGDEDYGDDIFETNQYDAEIFGSIDGYNVYQDQQQVLDERTDVVDGVINLNTGRSKYFTCYNTGIYHIISIKALQAEQSFHVKTVDVPLIPVGRI